MTMNFEWDDEKATTNWIKHGVPFTEALTVFLDVNRLDRYDRREDYGEDRFLTIGLADGFELTIAYTLRGDTIRISPPERPPAMNNATTGKTVRFTLDPANPPKMSAATKSRLMAMQDENIDLSDIPASPVDSDWTRPGIRFSTNNKQQVTLRLDADVLDYFRLSGPRYQTRINLVLRTYMQAHSQQHAKR